MTRMIINWTLRCNTYLIHSFFSRRIKYAVNVLNRILSHFTHTRFPSSLENIFDPLKSQCQGYCDKLQKSDNRTISRVSLTLVSLMIRNEMLNSRVIESNFGYSVGTGYADGGTTGRCHKRVEEPRGEPIRPSSGSCWSTRFHLLPHITTSARPFGENSTKKLKSFFERGSKISFR